MIPAEAVEAASEAVLYGLDAGHHAYKIAHAALEAAGPYVMRTAWDEGWEARGDWGGSTPNPYARKCHELPTTS